MPQLDQWGRLELALTPKRSRPRCGAKTRAGISCQAPVLPNGRCKLHGGRSTGPKSQAGRDRISAVQTARWERWRAEREASDH